MRLTNLLLVLCLGAISIGAVLAEAQAYQANAYPFSAVAVDASQFCTGGFNAVLHTCINSSNSTGSTGNTMWEAISAAIASPLNVSGVIDARAFQGPQIVKAGVGTTALYGCNGNTSACQVGGVSTATPPGTKVNGVLLLGNVTNYCDGLSSSSNYTDGNSSYGTPCIIVPWGFQIIGSAQFTTNAVGTTFAACLGSNNPVTGCNTAFPKRSLSISAISVTSTTMTLTSSTSLTTGGPPNQNIYVGELVAITGTTNSAYNVLRTVQTVVPSPTNTFTVSVPSGTSTTGCSGGSCGTAYLVTPLIGFGYQNNNGSLPTNACNVNTGTLQCAYVPVRVGANQSFASRVINLSFDLESQPGAVAVQNLNGGEQSGMSTIYCRHPSMGCVQVGNGANESGPYDNIYVQTMTQTTNVFPTTFGIYNGSAGAGFHRFTMTASYAAGQPWAAIYDDGSNVAFDGEPHNEGTYDTIELAPNTNVFGVRISGIVGPPSTSTSGVAGTNLVHILNDGYSVAGSTVSNITQQPSQMGNPAGSTYSVADDIHSNSVSDLYLPRYEFDKNGNPISSAIVQTSTSIPVLNGSGYSGNLTLPGATSGGIPYFNSSSGSLASSATLTANAVVIGGGAGTAPATISADSTTTHALFATAGAPAFRAVAAGDLPQSGTGSKTQSTNMSATTSSGDLVTVDGNANTVDSGISSTVPSFKRVAVGQASVLITSDFSLSSTWGSTASVAITNSTSRDQGFTITITAQGTGIGANPTATLTFHDGAWTNVPVYLCKKEGGTGSIASIIEQPATTTTLPITLVGTPTSGNTFIISCIGMGT